MSLQTEIRDYQQYLNPYWLDIIESLELPTSYKSAKGAYLVDYDDNQWLDLVAGYGSLSLGHNNKAVTAQIGQYLSSDIPTIYPWAANLQAAKLAARLAKLSPINNARVVFSCSGSEAIESGLKMAMAFNQRQRFISFNRGFHGMTLAAMALNGDPIWSSSLPERTLCNEQFSCVADLASCQELLETEQYSAVVIEIVQGIGGGHKWTDEQLATLAENCKNYGTCLIVDEVQTGIGRTGRMFASDRFPENIQPDIIVVAKGLTGGDLPLSATICKTEIHHALFGQPNGARIHGSTYSGYTTGIAAAMAVLDYIEQHAVLDQVRHSSSYLRQRLALLQQQHDCIESVEGDGLLVTVTFSHLAPELAHFCLQNFFANQILVNLSAHRDNTIKISPPLNIKTEMLDEFFDVLAAILEAY